MKLQHLLCISALAILTSCKNEEKSTDNQTAATDTLTTSDADTAHVAPATKKAKKSVATDTEAEPWQGRYSGILPCGDCKGIMTLIKLEPDNTYSLTTQYIGKGAKPSNYQGKYHFDTSKNMVTLDAEGDHLKFQVQGGMLIKRDKFGNPEQGGEEARYYLHPLK